MNNSHPVSHGHEVSGSTPSHDLLTLRILEEVQAGESLSQRSLSRRIGAALGLTNFLIRRLARKGLIKVAKARPNTVRYLITPAGMAEKAKVSQMFFENAVRMYTMTRQRVQGSLLEVGATIPDGGSRRVVFYGAGDVAELAFLSLRSARLELVGVIDDKREGDFFGYTIQPSSALAGATLDGQEFDRLGIMTIRHGDDIRRRLEAAGFPMERAFEL